MAKGSNGIPGIETNASHWIYYYCVLPYISVNHDAAHLNTFGCPDIADPDRIHPTLQYINVSQREPVGMRDGELVNSAVESSVFSRSPQNFSRTLKTVLFY